MKIFSNSIKHGYFDDKIGKRGSQFIAGEISSYSFHLGWSDLPAGTQSLALIFVDHDAIPVCGFSWIHWTVANIEPSINELAENASTSMNLLQGVNSFASPIIAEHWKLSREDAISYGGCAPPDKDHIYTVTLYALNKKLDIQAGFFANELINKMQGNILGSATLTGVYKV